MTPNEYQELADKTCNHNYVSMAGRVESALLMDLIHGSVGINTESGELSDAIKKHLIYGKPLDHQNIIEECGDLLWYISLVLKSVNCSMKTCMEENINKLKICYPDKFTEKDALERKNKLPICDCGEHEACNICQPHEH